MVEFATRVCMHDAQSRNFKIVILQITVALSNFIDQKMIRINGFCK